MDNVLLNEHVNNLKEELYELEMSNNINLDEYNNKETLALRDFVLSNSEFLKNYSQFEIANIIDSQEGTDYLTEQSKANEKGDINNEELKNINNQPTDA